MIKELTWHLIKENLAKDNEVKVEQADLMEIAKATTRAQFANYGMMEVPADMLEKYSADMLKDEKSRRNLIERAVEDKVRDAVKAQITLNEKAISQEDFYKLFEAQA
jgi:trigger factor